MANIFNFLQDIVTKKKADLLNDIDNEAQFQPWMVQRWLSMFSSEFASLLNSTSNRLYPVFGTKSDWYKLFLTLIPQSKFKKIYYIRKNKEKQTEDKTNAKEVIAYLARNKKLSQREVELYVDQLGIDLKEFKKKI